MNTMYDLVIIGAGGGGITSAFEAQRLGAKVALLEKHKIGGECTHSGCVPSKALIDVAKTSIASTIQAPTVCILSM